MTLLKQISFRERAELCTNPIAKKLFQIMDEKKSNLCHNPDVTSSTKLLEIADAVGPEICLLKTHIDILEDFTPEVTHKLRSLADKHNFLIFEDRKFADIGHVVDLQFRKGIYRIADWADIINAHPMPGPGIIEGLKSALLLVAEMSSKGNLCSETYTKQTVEMAKEHAEFVIGFITQHRLTDDPRFIHMTPGVKLQQDSDTLGQQYNTPHHAIAEKGNDLIIVGRGILQAKDPALEAKKYREAGWKAYRS